jgi:hypothetical protein
MTVLLDKASGATCALDRKDISIRTRPAHVSTVLFARLFRPACN